MDTVNESLLQLSQTGLRSLYPESPRVTVGMGTCGRAAGAEPLFGQLKISFKDTDIELVPVGCNGACWAEPLVSVWLPNHPRYLFRNVDETLAERIACSILEGTPLPGKHVLGVQDCDRFALIDTTRTLASIPYEREETRIDDLPYFSIQNRRVTGKCGLISPASIEEYCACGGFRALEMALGSMTPDGIISVVEDSGLRGRGGAGFPTGRKWRITAHQQCTPLRYVIANADEGDPGAFMNRSLLEGDPFAVIEGLTIAGLAIGAHDGYIFTRSEYPLALQTLQTAIEHAENHNVLGGNILGSGWSFHIGIVRSAGAYICGEETAMIRAMEGFPGHPRKRPPYPSEKGLWDAPTCIDNVETLANIPLIIQRGPQWFKETGISTSPGTKVFSLAGSISKTGTMEVPMGTHLTDIEKVLEADEEDEAYLKAIQIGGPSGVLIPSDIDATLDYEGLAKTGGAIGSGGIVFLDERSCIVDTVKYFMSFSQKESCGQCQNCRQGIARCLEILTRLTEGKGNDSDIETLESIASTFESSLLCGLGKMAARPLLSSLRYFPEEYRDHVDGHCPGRVCKPLFRFTVDMPKCPGCRCCLPSCPTNAMKGGFGKPYTINSELCIRCWMCTSVCPYDAVLTVDM